MVDIPESTKSGLEIAHDIIATDLADAEEHCDPDWIDQSKTALDAIIECLATRAAPSAMDREAVADIIAANVSGPNLRMLGIDPALHRDDQLRAADLILSTLSADAIRQGEGLDHKVGAFVSNYEFRGDDGDFTPDDMTKAIIEDAIHGFLAEHLPATPASHASDGEKA